MSIDTSLEVLENGTVFLTLDRPDTPEESVFYEVIDYKMSQALLRLDAFSRAGEPIVQWSSFADNRTKFALWELGLIMPNPVDQEWIDTFSITTFGRFVVAMLTKSAHLMIYAPMEDE